MLDYASQRVRETLARAQTAVLGTSGPAGVQVSEVFCQALDLDLYLLIPRTSDHLFNLEHDPAVTLLAAACELRGVAYIIPADAADPGLDLLREPGAEWCALVRVEPRRVQIRKAGGWGNLETIDLSPVPDSITRPQRG